MNPRLQLILIVSSFLFLVYIIMMVRNKRLELKYILVWMLTGAAFLLLSIFPSILDFASEMLNIIEPVHTLFLMIIFFMLLIIFSLTVALSRNSIRVKALTQELGILKLQIENLLPEKENFLINGNDKK